MPPYSLQHELQEALRDSFTLERELPRGGMSRVFVATENALGRRVVLKVLSPELAASLSAERFKREIALAARLQHPHIVPLLSAGVAGQHLYYTMPLVDGESLRNYMDRLRPMPIADVVRIVGEISGALAYAHEQGVVHRDMKPENVMFFHGQAVVLDFGIAKALARAVAPDNESPRITLAGTSVGTPAYIAPEQARGDPELDHRADLYALGVLSYEMLAGTPPFTGRSPVIVLQAHAERKPDPITDRRPDVPAHLAELVMACLEKKPADRPRDGVEIMRRLTPSAAMTSVMTPAENTEIPRQLRKLPSWTPWAIAAISTLAAIVLAVLYATRA